MKKLKTSLTALLLVAMTSLAMQPAPSPVPQEKWQTYGIFRYKLPPNWSLYEEHTNEEYLTFRHVINGELTYIVRLRHKGTITRHERDFKTHIATLTKTHAERKDDIDHVEEQSRYKTLGVDRCHMMSYLAPAFNHRGFLFTPVIDGKMYYVHVFDKKEKKKELRREAADFISGISLIPEEPELLVQKDKTSTGSASASVGIPGETIPAAKPLPFLDIKTITASQWDGAVAGAMEGMRLVYGPMNEAEEAEFMNAWAPLRQTPFREAVDYLNKFNPLLGEFLVYRTAVVQTSQLLEEAVRNAGYAAEFDDPGGVRNYMDLASRYQALLLSRQKRLDQVARALTDLGNPPDGRELMTRRQSRYKKEKEFLESLLNDFTPEGCWAGTQNQFYDPTWKFGEVWFPRYFYIYKIDTPDGEKYYDIELCGECNYTSLPGKSTVKGNMGDRFIRRELTTPDYYGRGVGGANDGKIFHHFVRFDYPAIPSFPETSSARFKELIATGEKVNNTVFNATFTKQMTLNSMAAAFFKTAVRWSEEERWDDFAHDPESVFIPDELKKAFGSEMAGGASPATLAAQTPARKPDTPGAQPAAKGSAGDDHSAEERRKINEETIAFHKTNLAIIEKNMVRDREELKKESDPRRREALQLRILGAQADLQAEKDRIATIQTGEIVHSRSPWDEYARAGFIQNIAQNQQRLENISRSVRKAYEMADKLPEAQAREARAVIGSKFRGEMVGNLDEAAVRAIVEEANDVGRKYYEEKMAVDRAANKEAVAEADWADACLQTAQVVKTTADYSMMGLSLFGGQYVNNIYQGVTGYIEGGPKEAFLRVAGSYNTVTGIAVDGFRGFENAVNNGGDFMDGLKGAAGEAAKGYITSKALSYGAGKISSTFARPNGPLPDLDNPSAGKSGASPVAKSGSPVAAQSGTSAAAQRGASPEVQSGSSASAKGGTSPVAKGGTSPVAKGGSTPDAPGQAGTRGRPAIDADDFNRPLSPQEMAVYREQVADARIRVTSYKKTYEKLEAARQAGAPPSEIKKILVELDDRSAKIHSSPQAKMMMKTLQKDPSNLDLIKRYSNSMDRIHQRVEKRYHQEMDARGWSREELEAIRNRPDPAELQRAREKQARGETVQPEDLLGSKTVNMDYDAGRKARTGPDGRPLPPVKNGEPTSVETWHTEAQEAWEKAFQAETGQNAAHSWENITHSKVGDAYADLNVLQKNGILHANKAWAGQTADVTYYKGEHIRQSPEFQRVEKYVEIARGTAKDYRTKMGPLMESKKPQPGTASHEAWQQHKTYWDKMSDIMDQMGSGRKDPLTADREVRELTGGKSLLEVTFDMRNFMESLMKL
jgi:hypothetical protein